MFMKALDSARAAGADGRDRRLHPARELRAAREPVATYPYVRQGTEQFLKKFGPTRIRTAAEYRKAVGGPLSPSIDRDRRRTSRGSAASRSRSAVSRTIPKPSANYYGPKRATLAAYLEPLDRLQLDGYVYPAIQMPPPDETMPQDGGISGGPHSATSWVNMIGVPAVVVAGGLYASGLPFGLEFSTRPWKDGDLLGYAYAWEQATH